MNKSGAGDPIEGGYFVKFWGTRGSIPTPGFRTRKYGGNTACIELRIDGSLMICDGGSGIRDLGIELAATGEPVHGHMFFSHPHWDHIQGFPFFTPVYGPKNTFHIYGDKKGDRRIFELLSGQMQSDYFPVSFSELGAVLIANDLESVDNLIDGVRVDAYDQTHPGHSFAFSFKKNGIKTVFATDNELDLVIENPDESKANLQTMRLIPKSYLDFVRDADLLIADGQYTDEEYPKRTGWGHARATTITDAAVQANVKQLAIFHHDPMHSDDEVEQIVEVCRARARRHGSSLVVFGAREGLELKLS